MSEEDKIDIQEGEHQIPSHAHMQYVVEQNDGEHLDLTSENESSKSGEGDREANRLILKYPDGTYSYAYKSGSRDAWLEMRPQGQNAHRNEGLRPF